MAVESLVSLKIRFSGYFEPLFLSPACNDLSEECDDWLFTENVAKFGIN